MVTFEKLVLVMSNTELPLHHYTISASEATYTKFSMKYYSMSRTKHGDLGFGNGFLNTILKVQDTKEQNIYILEYIKI